MKSSSWVLRSGLGWLGLVLVLGVASGARADDQQICSSFDFHGPPSTNYFATGFETTDIFDTLHFCEAKGCTACNTYSSPPKNAGFYLCIPNAVAYSITPSCESLLTTGTSENCESNIFLSPTKAAVICGPDESLVAPSCNWRTNANTNAASWNWTLRVNISDGLFLLSCSNTNFQGPEQ